jgi:hypothetical protein
VSCTKTSTVNLCKFVDEIEKVDRMYFGNIVIEINLRDDISYSDLNDEEDEVSESELTEIHPTLVWNAVN